MNAYQAYWSQAIRNLADSSVMYFRIADMSWDQIRDVLMTRYSDEIVEQAIWDGIRKECRREQPVSGI